MLWFKKKKKILGNSIHERGVLSNGSFISRLLACRPHLVRMGDWRPKLSLFSKLSLSLLPLCPTLPSSWPLKVFIKLDCTGKCNQSVPGHEWVTCWPQEKRGGEKKVIITGAVAHTLQLQLPTPSAMVTSDELWAQPPWLEEQHLRSRWTKPAICSCSRILYFQMVLSGRVFFVFLHPKWEKSCHIYWLHMPPNPELPWHWRAIKEQEKIILQISKDLQTGKYTLGGRYCPPKL